MRLSIEELESVKQKYGVDELWSWSKVNTAMTSMYEYFLKYILKLKEDRNDCAYGVMGGLCHSIIEDLYGGKIKYEDMIERFQDGWLTAIDLAGLKFDRNDAEKNESIAAKYKSNLEHFFQNHQTIQSNAVLEQFVTARIGDYVLQGYIDCLYKDADGCYNIVDWKTSTKYSGKKAEEMCGQLVVYAVGMNQAGVALDRIKVGWNFLKYAHIQYKQKNGAVKTKDVERAKIGESLLSNARLWLQEYGYGDNADDYLKILCDFNDISVLPEEVRRLYAVSDCYIRVPLTQNLIDKWMNTIVSTIQDVKSREADYHATKNDQVFYDSEDDVRTQSYYFATLCGYSPTLHLPYKRYLERLESEKNGESLFAGVGSESGDEAAITNKDILKNNDSLDLSWLDNV